MQSVQQAIKEFTNEDMLHSVYITENLVEPIVNYFKTNHETKQIMVNKKGSATPNSALIYGTEFPIYTHADLSHKRTHIVISKYDKDEIMSILDSQNVTYNNGDVM